MVLRASGGTEGSIPLRFRDVNKIDATLTEIKPRARNRLGTIKADVLGYGIVTVGIQVVPAKYVLAPSKDHLPTACANGRRRESPAQGGRRRHETVHPELVPALEKLVAPATSGDPESALRWTNKSTHALSAEMFTEYGIRVGDKTVARLLRKSGYSLQAPCKTVEGKQHPDRNAQFEYINAQAMDCLKRGVPFISVDTKKKELVGNFKNAGREWQPQDEPELVDVHEFPSDAVGKAIPYGVYDVAANNAFVSVGTDHDTPLFAVTSIETWWKRMGAERYPHARELFITADAGGSNSYRSRVWKAELQRLADELGIVIHVSHFPPSTSKWNKIEHRLFSFISINSGELTAEFNRARRRRDRVHVSSIKRALRRHGYVVKARRGARRSDSHELGHEPDVARSDSAHRMGRAVDGSVIPSRLGG